MSDASSSAIVLASLTLSLPLLPSISPQTSHEKRKVVARKCSKQVKRPREGYAKLGKINLAKKVHKI